MERAVSAVPTPLPPPWLFVCCFDGTVAVRKSFGTSASTCCATMRGRLDVSCHARHQGYDGKEVNFGATFFQPALRRSPREWPLGSFEFAKYAAVNCYSTLTKAWFKPSFDWDASGHLGEWPQLTRQ